MFVCGLAPIVAAAPATYAQSPVPFPSGPAPLPSPTPSPVPSLINSDISAGNQTLNLGSSFLERLGNQATNGFDRSLRNNPAGGGASEATQGPRYRTWGEIYGLSTTTDAQGDFAGDKRRTAGGVAGFGAQIMPGVNIGFSVDQSHTSIDVPLAFQTATLDLTQLGFNAAVDKGPWTWAIALVHGFGSIGSSRDTGLGFANASYGARLDGALTEIDYYWQLGQGRIVPKAGLEYVRSTTGSLQENTFIPRSAKSPEGDGYVIGVGANTAEMESEIYIIDSMHMEAGPVATIKLPFRLRGGTHTNWYPASQISV